MISDNSCELWCPQIGSAGFTGGPEYGIYAYLMAANLTPQYLKAEERYKKAQTDDERLEALQEMFQLLPKHKASEKMQADLKSRISQLKKDSAAKKAAKAPTVDFYHVPKSGAGQVVLMGLPNVGKSMLVATTTNASVKVADYPYTTAIPAPGMWNYEDVQIQLVDTPPVTAEHVPGGLLGTIRSADIIALVVDVSTDPLEQTEVLVGILTGRGLEISTTPKNKLAGPESNQRCTVILATKADLPGAADSIQVLRELYEPKLQVLAVSASTSEGLDALNRRLWELLSVIRVYTKEPGKPVDKDRPYILPIGSTVADLAASIHRDLPEKMKFARVWGDGRYAGAQVHRTDTLQDKDVVEIHQ